MPCPRKVYKHAGSLQVCIPPHVAEHLNIVAGDYINWNIEVKGHAIIDRWFPPVQLSQIPRPLPLQERETPE